MYITCHKHSELAAGAIKESTFHSQAWIMLLCLLVTTHTSLSLIGCYCTKMDH